MGIKGIVLTPVTSWSVIHWVKLQESCRKASIICPESEIEALGGCDGSTPEQLSAQLTRLNQRLQHESQRWGHYHLSLYHLKNSQVGFFLVKYLISFFFFQFVDILNRLMTLGCCMRKKNVRFQKNRKLTKHFEKN